MPIYEYLCGRCNTIFQFLVRKPSSGTSPVCPGCGKGDRMERVMSAFSVKRGSASMDAIADDPDLAGLETEDPRAMAKAIRRMADEMGEDLGPGVNEALCRLEAGEDPEKVERELEESGFEVGGEQGKPVRAPGLYEC
jgi:putative FmdB family regulatory protein